MIGGDASCRDEGGPLRVVAAKPVDGICRSIDQRIANGELDRCGEIGRVPSIEAADRDQPAHRRLQSREREVAPRPTLEWPGQDKAVRIALASGVFDRRAAGIAEPDQLCGLIESLSGRVVKRGAKASVKPDSSAYQELTVPAGDQQNKIGEIDTIGQPGGQCVTFEVVDRDKRLAGTPRNPFSHHRADNQPAYETRARSGGYSVDLSERDIGLGERAVDQSIEMIEMRPRGNLGYDPTERCMFGELRPKLIG